MLVCMFHFLYLFLSYQLSACEQIRRDMCFCRASPHLDDFPICTTIYIIPSLTPNRKAGATCNGPPGPRPQYREGYYAAFVLDPDGHNIEAMYFSCWWVTALSWAPTVLGAAGIAGLSWWLGKTGKGFQNGNVL